MNIVLTAGIFAIAYAITFLIFLRWRGKSTYWTGYVLGILLGLVIGWLICYTMYLLHKYLGV